MSFPERSISQSPKGDQVLAELPPSGGEYEAVVPHLTVARVNEPGQDGVAAELPEKMPPGAVVALCRELALLANSIGQWAEVQRFALAAAVPA